MIIFGFLFKKKKCSVNDARDESTDIGPCTIKDKIIHPLRDH